MHTFCARKVKSSRKSGKVQANKKSVECRLTFASLRFFVKCKFRIFVIMLWPSFLSQVPSLLPVKNAFKRRRVT